MNNHACKCISVKQCVNISIVSIVLMQNWKLLKDETFITIQADGDLPFIRYSTVSVTTLLRHWDTRWRPVQVMGQRRFSAAREECTTRRCCPRVAACARRRTSTGGRQQWRHRQRRASCYRRWRHLMTLFVAIRRRVTAALPHHTCPTNHLILLILLPARCLQQVLPSN